MSQINVEAAIAAVDALLPQTQCRQCAYADCRSYAAAIVTEGETINRCLPGGVKVLRELGALLNQDVETFEPEMTEKTRLPQLAVIREAECIGCAKCIQACPVDAIIGSAKLMHTVIADVCTGCELCVPPCPVDCIDLVPTATSVSSTASPAQSGRRYQERTMRLARQEVKLSQTTPRETLEVRQAAIQAAVARRGVKSLILKN
jgi:Na+-translocating ferredoxin:NAD+ oxidoreductase subunit B